MYDHVKFNGWLRAFMPLVVYTTAPRASGPLFQIHAVARSLNMYLQSLPQFTGYNCDNTLLREAGRELWVNACRGVKCLQMKRANERGVAVICRSGPYPFTMKCWEESESRPIHDELDTRGSHSQTSGSGLGLTW